MFFGIHTGKDIRARALAPSQAKRNIGNTKWEFVSAKAFLVDISYLVSHTSRTRCSGNTMPFLERMSEHQSRTISSTVISIEASFGMSLSRMRKPSHTLGKQVDGFVLLHGPARPCTPCMDMEVGNTPNQAKTSQTRVQLYTKVLHGQ